MDNILQYKSPPPVPKTLLYNRRKMRVVYTEILRGVGARDGDSRGTEKSGSWQRSLPRRRRAVCVPAPVCAARVRRLPVLRGAGRRPLRRGRAEVRGRGGRVLRRRRRVRRGRGRCGHSQRGRTKIGPPNTHSTWATTARRATSGSTWGTRGRGPRPARLASSAGSSG
jgi:hypothetical protein